MNKTGISSELIKMRRKELGLDQTVMAKKIGIGRSQYCNIEIGNCNPSIPVLISLIRVLEISFEELYGLVPSQKLIEIKKKRISELKDELATLEKYINH